MDDPARFTEPLDHVDALYFTTTTFATVGFGDVAPRGDLTRVLVTLQMVLGLVLAGLVVRLLMRAAREASSAGHGTVDGAHDDA